MNRQNSIGDGRRYFSDNYTQARNRFVDLAQGAGARHYGYELSVKGPNQETLITDIAWLGDPLAKQILIVQSGVHGVEAFAGSAIQCRVLDSPPVIGGETALILVHVINPYGMAWLRRVNESNVDLNRNCLMPGESYSGAPTGYDDVNKLINPVSEPQRDLFLFKLLYQAMRQGMAPLKHAIARGQYEYPVGLFYGGSKLEQEPMMLRQWMHEHIPSIEKLVVVDLHTGLGRFAEQLIFSAFAMDAGTRVALEKSLGREIFVDDKGKDGYSTRGGMSALYKQLFDHADPQYLTVEFGTYPQIKVLRALREENRYHFYAGGDMDHRAGRMLKNALCPDSRKWQERVVGDGCELVFNALMSLGERADDPGVGD